MKSILRIALVTLLASMTGAACADDFGDVKKLSQDAFLRLSKDLASVTALRALSPGVALNFFGVDVGVELGITKVENGGEWQQAGGGSTSVVTPRVSIHKGLGGGFDIGASIGTAGGSGLSTIGGIVRYQAIEPTTLLPGLGFRLTGNREYGSSSVQVRSLGLDAIVAKPLLVITPYIGLGTVRTDTKAPGTTLADTSVSRSRVFVGFDSKLAFATVSAEAEKSGGATTISSKIGFRF
ncbi:MAG: hypothetical protein HY255_12230 [Betaproteobacteria bacterium]|nr:hypothetical protein [Betaproteobacteria bacterium]